DLPGAGSKLERTSAARGDSFISSRPQSVRSTIGASAAQAYAQPARRSAMTEQVELTRPDTREKIQTVNPATEEPGRSFDWTSIDDAHAAAATAHGAFQDWRRTSFADRAAVMRRTAEVLRTRKDELARLM